MTSGFRLGFAKADQRAAGGAGAPGRHETRVDEDFVAAEREVAAFLVGAAGEGFVGDGVVQVVGGAAVPDHEEPWCSWAAVAARHVRVLCLPGVLKSSNLGGGREPRAETLEFGRVDVALGSLTCIYWC